MSKTTIPPKVKTQLWTLSGGRCEYRGCNKALWRDDLTMANMNKAYLAHIVADSEGGPRGDKNRSPLLAKDFNNIMFLCDEHHRLIDKEDVIGHPESLLIEMKQEHEKRIELLTSLMEENKTNIVFYGANIGQQDAPLNYNNVVQAVLPNRYPSDSYGIQLGLHNSNFYDSEDLYWDLENVNLCRQFKDKIKYLGSKDIVKHFSVFALAPMPLLIRLGTLFSSIQDVDVFQLHKEPSSWKWQDGSKEETFKLIEPTSYDGIPVLNISLSGTITDDRIKKVLTEKTSIWTLTIDNPNNDYLTSKQMLSDYRIICRSLFDKIKQVHGQDSKLHIFPAMGISSAIELGRIWTEKADVSMVVYDQNKERNGFIKTIEII
ncbi:MAG: SAVED domain-containing protein [Marinifilaceae bacterium]